MSGIIGHRGLLLGVAAGPPPAGVTWDPAVLSAPAVLSGSDLRLTADTAPSGNYANTRSTKAITGLAYMSGTVAVNSGGATVGFGVSDATVNFTNAAYWIGNSAALDVAPWASNGTIYLAGAGAGTVGSMGSPDQIEIAVRVATRRVWIRKAGGAWVGGGDPAADTSPTTTLGGTGALYMAATVTKSGATSGRYVELNATAGTTTGTPPAGFTAANWAP